MDDREPSHHDDYRQELEDEFRRLREQVNEMRAERVKSLLDREKFTSRMIILLSLCLILVRPAVFNNVVSSQFYPIFSITLLVAVFTLIALSLVNLLNARGVLNDD